jgi:hypothetical protein
MTDGWGGDPGHSGAKPMMHLQGGMAAPHTQTPMTSEAMTGGRVGATDTAPIDTGWEAFLSSSGGDTPNRGTDARNKTT